MTSMDGGNAGNAGAVGSADSFIYGENNRLKEAGIGGSPLATYSYNGRGERVKKLGTATTYYYYDSNGQLIAELDGSGNTVREYVYLGGQPLALITAGNVYTIHTDHLGTPQIITDQSQNTVWNADYEPFGQTTITTETVINNLRFPGQYFDGKTGLHYNYFRDYDPETGRYVESDPIGLYGGINTYLYAYANPIHLPDPSGLITFNCKRPLEGKPGENTKNGPDIPGNPSYHEYNCATQPDGTLRCDSSSPTDSWGGSIWDYLLPAQPGVPSDPDKDYYHPDACEVVEDDGNNYVEMCLTKYWDKPRPSYGVPGGMDCQEYSHSTLDDCLAQCKNNK